MQRRPNHSDSTPAPARLSRGTAQSGSALVVVMWVAFGLVSLALYFAHSMSMELRASENRAAAIAAEQAIDGASRYVNYLLSNLDLPGALPELSNYQREGVAIGAANFWFIGRDERQTSPTEPQFSLVDENSKINLNTATVDMLLALPRMTPTLAAAIIDWRDADGEITSGGAEDETYSRRTPPYKCKNEKFESVEELRLVAGADFEILYGEDTNRNGVLDPNENDGDTTPPNDNRDGKLDLGIIEYVTVYSRESNLKSDGTQKVSITDQAQLLALLQEKLGMARADANRTIQIFWPQNGGGQNGGPPGGGAAGGTGPRSMLDFINRSGLTDSQLTTLAPEICSTNGVIEGLINVNTASEAVLTCVPGIGQNKAATIVAQRQSNTDKRNSLVWLKTVLTTDAEIRAAGPYVTGQSYQVTADIAGVGPNQRGYRRIRYVFDASDGTNRVIARQDLSSLGWALGQQVRQNLIVAKANR